MKRKTLYERAFEISGKQANNVNAPPHYIAGFSHGFRDGWLAGYRAAQRDRRK